ncbi:hypothetical protein XBJ2_2080019 [Xenorhabdus bovienii str. Jollieti]|uniref:Uncharacterized protein n=1 Tax=Xenorhabdus bovienii (strain SS-2004) TaxID=406818 RepID=D3V6E8_XENBS|nr:hypothetical protein XBJ1_4115 [Xenorhabdus bovienii SS-2004]CDH28939.1 hypothetical protein XBJ2_2080019 [Xenorhabdus bovienii str. Jollieti]
MRYILLNALGRCCYSLKGKAKVHQKYDMQVNTLICSGLVKGHVINTVYCLTSVSTYRKIQFRIIDNNPQQN